MLGAVIASFASGAIVNTTGHYLAYLLIGPALGGAVGAGLLFTIDEYTSNARLIGYQIIFGVGLGIAFQLPGMSKNAISSPLTDSPFSQLWRSRQNMPRSLNSSRKHRRC